MEASATATAARTGSLQMPPALASRKEWRAVSENQPSRGAGNEVDLERQKTDQVDERTIYEQRRQSLDVSFCAMTIDGTSEDEVLRQLNGLSREREDLQQLEIQLRAQMIAKSEILEIRSDFDAQIKGHVDAAVKFQEQLREKEQALQDLERKMDEKDREIMAMKRDNEAAWAKDDLLREQKKELASFRRERDHLEAERLQHIQQIHELQEHAQDKERQLVELQEQHRVAQEAIMYKDEQLREAQAWIARMQEVDALQSHSLQAELQERTEQCNQLWLIWQRQFAEMEGFHLHRIQQLQLELADLKGRNGSFSDDSHLSHSGIKDGSQLGPSKGNQHDTNGSVGGTVPQNGNSGSSGTITLQNERMTGASLGSSTLLGFPAYIAPGQVNALHPIIMHQQAVSLPLNSNIPSPELGHHISLPSASPMQQLHSQQGASVGNEMSKQDQVLETQNNHNEVISESSYHFQKSTNGVVFQSGYMDVHVNQGMDQNSSISSSSKETQVAESIDGGYSSITASQLEATLPQISSNFHNSQALDTPKQSVETKDYATAAGSIESMADEQGSESEQTSMVAMSLPLVSKNNEAIDGSDLVGEVGPDMISGGQNRVDPGAKSPDSSLLDERSLLACVVRTIPAGGRIRISSTLPNRLAKMLAPLHWHDYKKKYGRLDEFVASHPDLFLIESDYIQLQEGAQEMIAAKAAVAKVAAAAAAASTTYSSTLPSVAVTPMAQAHRLRNPPSLGSKQFHAAEHVLVSSDDPLHVPGKHSYQNGVNFNISSSASSLKILTKSKDSIELNGVETKASHLSNFIANGEYVDKSGISSNQSKGASNGRLGTNFIPRPQGRTSGHISAVRR